MHISQATHKTVYISAFNEVASYLQVYLEFHIFFFSHTHTHTYIYIYIYVYIDVIIYTYIVWLFYHNTKIVFHALNISLYTVHV
jgi:hypothetical protein